MENDLLKKCQKKEKLNQNEIDDVLNYIRFTVKNYFDIDNRKVNRLAICNETTYLVGSIVDKLNLDMDFFDPKLFGINNLTHHNNIIKFNSFNSDLWYLVDFSYGQFFREDYFVDNTLIDTSKYLLDDGTYVDKTYFMTNDKQKEFAEELRYNGIVPLTDENIHLYFDGFIETFTKFNENDKNQFYNNLYTFVKENNINLQEDTKRKKQTL